MNWVQEPENPATELAQKTFNLTQNYPVINSQSTQPVYKDEFRDSEPHRVWRRLTQTHQFDFRNRMPETVAQTVAAVAAVATRETQATAVAMASITPFRSR